ncbi:hypothetical protein BGW39_001506 [Mortierella sp. 14UC]|nr:hypothetical protein BGW39_001506 [Mortierella sp. 14UC]
MRYDKIKRCLNEGIEKNLAAFLCVAQDTISIGGGGPLNPIPLNQTSSVFLCNMTSCPDEAPAKSTTNAKGGEGGKKHGGDSGSGTTNSGSGLVSERALSLSGCFVIALVISQMMLF